MKRDGYSLPALLLNTRCPITRPSSMGRLAIWIVVLLYLSCAVLAGGAATLEWLTNDSTDSPRWESDQERRQREGLLTVLPESAPKPAKKQGKPFHSEWKKARYVMKDGYVRIDVARGRLVTGGGYLATPRFWSVRKQGELIEGALRWSLNIIRYSCYLPIQQPPASE